MSDLEVHMGKRFMWYFDACSLQERTGLELPVFRKHYPGAAAMVDRFLADEEVWAG